MKSIRTLALVTGLLALSGVSQAQFSSTWTFVTDYDFRGYSQSARDPAIQASADYAFGESGLSVGIWASNVDFGVDDDLETDYYVNYVGTDQRHLRVHGRCDLLRLPAGPRICLAIPRATSA